MEELETTWSARKERIKAHISEHKNRYLIGAGCFVVGYALGKHGPDVIQTIEGTDNVATVVNRSKNVNVINTYLNMRNYNANPVRCLETNEQWPSQEEAAEAMGFAASILSQHLNGKFENAKGFHFERIVV